MKAPALIAIVAALAAGPAWAGCSGLSCTGNADVMITEIRQSSDNANLLLVMPYGYRTGISGCSLNTGSTLTLPHGAQGFKSIYPGLLQAILTGQYIRITLKAGAGCHVQSVDFVSTPINDTTGTGGTVCGLGYCSQ